MPDKIENDFRKAAQSVVNGFSETEKMVKVFTDLLVKEGEKKRAKKLAEQERSRAEKRREAEERFAEQKAKRKREEEVTGEVTPAPKRPKPSPPSAPKP